eukprot:2743242-Rhodomonas_salina.6
MSQTLHELRVAPTSTGEGISHVLCMSVRDSGGGGVKGARVASRRGCKREEGAGSGRRKGRMGRGKYKHG